MRMDVKCLGQLMAAEGGTPEGTVLEAIFDAVTVELHKLNAVDPFVGGSMATGAVEVGVTVEASEAADCLAAADGLIRCALHAAGVSTPTWDAADGREVTVELEEYSLVSA